ncbi:type I toxin-antitoxin system SymE family toxin [Xenorhabdus bovienii]|uniref:Toxin SymE-like domain-containing protein n=1 Tax=Xenorhabdus bovienii str. Intermedium TaxID=1379677 RepID=A0A077QFA4_XENBV|nr:SymE family type I addiction module toxin [Xenorhabdus bovienii]MDE9453153.1 type I toxin-antitoxin system SymE family toxin [Xenorhabdus bovienii]MDE9481506.1 type I toxin-antitoxin system SymE family toxin [Xenorhabdus bovienii]MDE9543374.1 type I toxin-antitoxin system SymE family toxin [Xenorhabdus bovienii]MDE9550478.1 type I toxin-antitoxin system SymE family toxin [Xenorhabdus bovienii]MDE9554596.1 type I toxin-antitoxin system SymE family toxin [Xenorhabdus bovienii]
MAEHDCISEQGISKAQRQYIVGYVPNRGDTSTPNINLKGKWLREAGFETGAHLTVKITNGCIVLVLDSEEVDDLKHEQEALRQQLRDIKQANRDMQSATKAALRGMRV